MDSNWSGGVVGTEGITPLYASGSFSYEILIGGGEVTFDTPIDSVDFFFVHGFGFAAGTATAFDSSDTEIGSVDSNPASFFGDPANFVSLDPVAPIARITFSGAVIDNFTFTAAGPPPVSDDTVGLFDPVKSRFFLNNSPHGATGARRCPECRSDAGADPADSPR